MTDKSWAAVCLAGIIERIALGLFQMYELGAASPWETAEEDWPRLSDEIKERYRANACQVLSDMAELEQSCGDFFIPALRLVQA